MSVRDTPPETVYLVNTFTQEWTEPIRMNPSHLKTLFKTHNHVDKNKSWKQILHLTNVNKKDKYIFHMFYSQIL